MSSGLQGATHSVTQPAHDAEAQSEAPFAVAFAIGDLKEIAEDPAQILLCDTDAGIDHDELDGRAARPGSEDDAAGRGIFYRVGNQVRQGPLQQFRGDQRPKAGGHDPHLQRLHVGLRLEVGDDPVEDVLQRRGGYPGVFHGGVGLRDAENGVELTIEARRAFGEPRQNLAPLDLILGARQQGVVETHGVQRLPEVVAGGAEETVAVLVYVADLLGLTGLDREQIGDFKPRLDRFTGLANR